MAGDFKVLCCFCDEKIESTNIDPCDVNILSNWDKPKYKQHNQNFWCHFNCFKRSMHPSLQQHLVIDLFRDKEE